MIAVLKGKEDVTQGPKLYIQAGSFFWGQLRKLKSLFIWSTSWIVGDGGSVSFWIDGWASLPLADSLAPTTRPPRPNISLQEALLLLHTIAPQFQVQEDIQVNRCASLEMDYDRILLSKFGL